MSVTQAAQIADMVRETRQHLGLTQEEFALKLVQRGRNNFSLYLVMSNPQIST